MFFFQINIKARVITNRGVTLSDDLCFYRHEKISSVKRQVVSKILNNSVRHRHVVMVHEKRVVEDEEDLYDTAVRNESVVYIHLDN